LPKLANSTIEPIVITLTHKGQLAESLEQKGIRVYQPHPYIKLIQRIPIFSRLFGPSITIIYLIIMYLRIPAKLTCFYLPASYCLGSIAALIVGENNKTIMFRRSLNKYQNKRPILSYIERKLHKKQLAIVANSQAVLRELVEEENVSKDKVALIYNGIDTSQFGGRKERGRLRHELGLNNNEIILCIVANLIPYKGHRDLIEALSIIKNKIKSPWVLLCVGAGIENRQDLIELVKYSGLTNHIKWLGRREDVPKILATSDIGLLVSYEEGFSNSILEGMASELPMIVTDVGGNSEAIEHQKNGLLIKPHDLKGLGEAILFLINNMDKARQYGKAGKLKVQKKFAIDSCVENYKSFFDKVI